MNREILLPKVHFVAGKGGVGKSTLCEGLARFFAINGEKTLHVGMSEEKSAGGAESVAQIISSDNNLFYLKLHPEQALYEYLSLKISKPNMLGSMFRNTLFRRLCLAMPGLADLTRLGKIWFHADEYHAGAKEIFDKVVVDLPSSGFVARFLSVAGVVENAVKVGPLAKEAALLNRYFSQSENACLHLVTLPKELVVNETIELAREVRKKCSMDLGLLFINRTLSVDDDLRAVFDDELNGEYIELNELKNFYHSRLNDEKNQLNRLKMKIKKMPIISLPEKFGQSAIKEIVPEIVSRLTSDINHE